MTLDSYEHMLGKLYKALPEKGTQTERFEVPNPDSMIQGSKTIIKNFSAIVKAIKRDEKHLFKYVTKETASAGAVADGRLYLNGKFGYMQVNRFFQNYLNQFVYCPVCKKPDTHVMERQGVRQLKCEACGAVSSVAGL